MADGGFDQLVIDYFAISCLRIISGIQTFAVTLFD